MTVPEALRVPELRPLWETAHRRLSSGHPVSRLRVGPLSDGQRGALADLLGRDRLPGEYCTVALDTLESVLAEAGTTVAETVTDLLGPVGNRAEAAARSVAEREDLWDWLARHEVVAAQPALAEWVRQVRRAGLVDGSVARTQTVLQSALAVLARLPAEGQPLPSLAAEITGDAHELDEGRRLSGLVLRALATLFGLEPPADAQQRRLLWERAGVADDQLSTTVLAGGLRLDGRGTGIEIGVLCADAGQAVALTLEQVRGTDVATAPPVVWAVENPSILAMAQRRFGAACPPVVCTSGWPNSAVTLLMRKLVGAGAHVYYHGDFDGEGLRIAAYVAGKTGALPWRMSAADYRAAAREMTEGPAPGRLTEVPWDTELAAAIRNRGMAVVEERVAELLLSDLRRSSVAP